MKNKKKIYTGEDAVKFLPDLIGDNKIKVISPVLDIFNGNEYLGHLLVFDGYQSELHNGKYFCKDLTEPQKKFKIKGSFVLLGLNPKFFHHLLKNTITGKYNEDGILVDSGFKSIVSYQFLLLMKHYLVKEIM